MHILSMNKERIFSIGISVLSVLLMIQAFRYPVESSQFPRFLCILMVVFSLMILIRTLKGKCVGCNSNTAGFSETAKFPVIVFSSALAYVLGISYIGYFVSTVAYMFSMMFIFGEKRIFPMLIAIAVFLGVVYALFVSFLGLRLPEGLLF